MAAESPKFQMLRRAPMSDIQHTTAASTSEAAARGGRWFALISPKNADARRSGNAVDAASKRAQHRPFLALSPFG